ncbi:MAG TPA: ACT domain-containing protein, partial [Ignavibacteriaceae bacterium]
KGFLSEEIDATVNFINSPVIAEEMGIVLEEIVSTDHSNYQNLIEAKIYTDSGEWKFSGTVFGNSDLRIVEINDYQVEFKPEGNILIYRNIDKPGMLASVSNTLSLLNINIASLSLGRKSEGDLALAVVNIDAQMNEEIKNTISSIDGIKDVYTVNI